MCARHLKAAHHLKTQQIDNNHTECVVVLHQTRALSSIHIEVQIQPSLCYCLRHYHRLCVQSVGRYN